MTEEREVELFFEENPFVNVLVHTVCGGLIDWDYIDDAEKSAALLGQLVDCREKYIRTMPEDSKKRFSICRCDYEFPEFITAD